MSGFFEGHMNASDRDANAQARFLPAVAAEDNNGMYAPPCVEVGGVQVYAYVRDGILVVSLHYDTADNGPDSPFMLYGPDDAVPTVIKAGDAAPVWEALPEDAVSEAGARIIRKTHADEPDTWPRVIPDWVNYERPERTGGGLLITSQGDKCVLQ